MSQPHPNLMPEPTPTRIVFAPTKQPPRCLNCDYLLHGVSRPRCPECGTGFDPNDSRTYTRSSPMPYWSPWQQFFGVVLGFAVGLAASVAIAIFNPLGNLGLAALVVIWPPVALIFLTGYSCRVWPTLGWCFVVMTSLALVGTLLSRGLNVPVFCNAVGAIGMIECPLAVLLLLGHAFRRWGPLNWFQSRPRVETT